MKIKLLFSLFIFATIIIFASSFSITYATVNEIRNFMSGAENTIEGAAGGAANMIRSGTNTMSGTMDNFINNNDMMNNENNQNTANGAMTMNNNNMTTGNYTATRTATTGDVTVAGISTNVWTWIIIAAAIVGIVTLVWSYMTQKNHRNSNYYDE